VFVFGPATWEYRGVEAPPNLLVSRVYNVDSSEYCAGGFEEAQEGATQLTYARISYHNRGIALTDLGYPTPSKPVEHAAAAIMHTVVQTESMYGRSELFIDEPAVNRDGLTLGFLLQYWGFRQLPPIGEGPVIYSGDPAKVDEALLSSYPWLSSMTQLRRPITIKS
jgi:hypothetical protein